MIRNTDRCELLVWTRAALDSPGLTDDDVVRLCNEAMEQSTLLVVAGDIDASSRLESEARTKDLTRVRAYVAAAKGK